VEMLGFLLYDEGKRALISQLPFAGVPDQFVEPYQIPAPAGSAAASLYRERDYWFTNNVPADPLAEENLLKTSGRGIFLMRAFMDEFEVRRPPGGGAEVVMARRYPARPGNNAAAP